MTMCTVMVRRVRGALGAGGPLPLPAATTWGWHRLQPDAARHVVRRAGIAPGDLVVDLGAGRGALTAALVAAGAHVVAVEVHPGRLADLRDRFAGRPVTVVDADIDRLRLPRRPFRVVANPPWALAETVRAALLRSPALVRADLVLPRWLVHRWAAGSPRIESAARCGPSRSPRRRRPAAPSPSSTAAAAERRYVADVGVAERRAGTSAACRPRRPSSRSRTARTSTAVLRRAHLRRRHGGRGRRRQHRHPGRHGLVRPPRPAGLRPRPTPRSASCGRSSTWSSPSPAGRPGGRRSTAVRRWPGPSRWR